MPNTRSDTAGLILTDISLGFYDLSKLQGAVWGTAAKISGLSRITHVGLILGFTERLTITLHPDGGAKLHKEKMFERYRIDEIPVGKYDVNLDLLVDFCRDYTDTTVKDALFYCFIGRYLGLSRPRVCTTLVCSLLGLPDFWHPAKLYRHMKGI